MLGGVVGLLLHQILPRLDFVPASFVVRGEEMLVPRGPTVLAAGDQLIAVATAAGYEHLRALASTV